MPSSTLGSQQGALFACTQPTDTPEAATGERLLITQVRVLPVGSNASLLCKVLIVAVPEIVTAPPASTTLPLPSMLRNSKPQPTPPGALLLPMSPSSNSSRSKTDLPLAGSRSVAAVAAV